MAQIKFTKEESDTIYRVIHACRDMRHFSGGEIGRAQALQAFACGIEATVDMNPVLIKPEADQQAQLMVRGQVVGKLEAKRFREDRIGWLSIVLESFEILKSEYDVVIVEGAGSPAEPNLREGDITNMGFTEVADVA